MSGSVIQTFPLGPQWPTLDPFLFVAHHDDAYPAANERLGPDASLAGRRLGQDFSGDDGWSMYHGLEVPGFPQHPHRGFETITYARQGYIDHSDSLGATARFGRGDTQWMTAGAGIQHAEMFPLVDPDASNPLELFQIWLNLPAARKLVEPYFTMLWSEVTPRHRTIDGNGAATEVTVIAGRLGEAEAGPPPPDSWAADPDADVAIWHIRMDADAVWLLPATAATSQRVLYAFDGSTVTLDEAETLAAGTGAVIRSDAEPVLVAGDTGIECMLLQGRPIAEPVARYGPFVMTSEAEIRQAVTDYQRTEFGGWPWSSSAPHHGSKRRRFAVHADGRREDLG